MDDLRILRYLEDEQEKISSSGGVPIQFVLIEMTPVQSVDTTSIHAFEELNNALKKRQIQVRHFFLNFREV
jgi:MFS superfamily sulfate permease-like transporter